MTDTRTTGAMSERTERPRTRVGRPFALKNPGRPRGLKDHRTRVGIAVCDAMSGQAAGVLRALLSARSTRIRLEACRTILGYSWGLPKQTLELAGGIGDLSRELALALVEVRARRASLDAVRPVASLDTLPSALPAPPGDEAEKVGTEGGK